MLIKTISYFLLLGVIFINGCGGGGSSDPNPIIPSAKPTLAVGAVYSATGITVTNTNCSNPAGNGPFPFANAILTVTEFTDPDFKADLVLNANQNNISYQSKSAVSGTLQQNGDISGTFTFEFIVDNLTDSSGDGTFSGSVSGSTLIFDFTSQDKAGDTCTTTGSIALNTGNNFGALQVTDDQTSVTTTVLFTNAINTQNLAFSWITDPGVNAYSIVYGKALGTVTVTVPNNIYSCGPCSQLPLINTTAKTISFSNFKVMNSALTLSLTLNGTLAYPDPTTP